MDTKKQQNEATELNVVEAVKKNKNGIIWGIVAVVVIALGGVALAWYFQGKSDKIAEIEAAADLSTLDASADSVVLFNYMQAANAGSDRAALEVAIRYYNDGQYNEALEMLKKASVKSEIIEAGRYSLMGDCYVNLNKYDEAVKAFKDAIKASDKNPQIAPFELIKLANVYRAQGNYKEELAAYEQILNDYPDYAANLVNQRNGVDLRKYIERAKASASQN